MKRFTGGEIGKSRCFILAAVFKVAEREGFGVPLSLTLTSITDSSYGVWMNFGSLGELPLDPIFRVTTEEDTAHVTVGRCIGLGRLHEQDWKVKQKKTFWWKRTKLVVRRA